MGEVIRRRPGRNSKPPTNARKQVSRVPDRYMAFVEGKITVQDLDDEEIFRGQLRNQRGDFRGRPPKFIPREFATAVQQEAAKRFMAEVGGLLPESLEAIKRVLQKQHPQPGDGATVQAAFKVIERFAGRVPETLRLESAADSKWANSAAAVVTHEIIDAEIIEEEDE